MPANHNAYDLTAYPSQAIQGTNPEHLAAIALGNGIDPGDPSRCRYLEIGCGIGWNVISMAAMSPESEFVGIDLAASAIEEGKRHVEALGLKNIRLQQMDLMDAGASLGDFDFISAHGVYAWVPTFVGDRLLQVISERLRPSGIGYVSYNCRPWAKLREMVRSMVLRAVDQSQPLDVWLRQAADFLHLLRDATVEPGIVQSVADDEVKKLEKAGIAYVRHDLLAEVWNPSRFSDFAKKAALRGLDCFDNAGSGPAPESLLHKEALAKVREMTEGDPVRYQQLLDDIVTRSFRATLLCHKKLKRGPELLPLDRLFLSAHVEIEPAAGGKGIMIENGEGSKAPVVDPDTIHAFERLKAAWPQSIPATQAGFAPEKLWAYFKNGFVTARQQPSVARMPGEKPEATALARYQMQTRCPFVTTLEHEPLRINGEPAVILISSADGATTRGQLIEKLKTAAPTPELAAAIEKDFEPQLHNLATHALFVQ
jgi:SAM-dependent methyltransferase